MNSSVLKKIIRRINNKFFSQDLKFKRRLNKFKKGYSKLNKKSPLVLIWDLGGFVDILRKNAILSTALNLRGYRTHFIICDGLSSACMQRGLEVKEELEDWPKKCAWCSNSMQSMAKKYRVKYSLISDFVSKEKAATFENISSTIPLKDIINYKYLDISVGAIAWSSTNRYMKGFLTSFSDLDEKTEKIYRKYFYAALINTYLANEAIENLKPISILVSHGVYVDYAPPILLGVKKGLSSISWSSGYADFLHYFSIPRSKEKLQLRGIDDIEWGRRKNKDLTFEENKLLDDFIFNRYFKKQALDISILSDPVGVDKLKLSLDIKNNNPVATIFSHVNWDACFDFSTMIFESANQWVVESIRKMIQIKDINWIIRVHPGELTNMSLFTTDDLIKKNFKTIPEHIKIIWSTSKINTYDLCKLTDVGITIFGTIGAELPSFGKPVIAAGDAHFSNKGFSFDAKNKEEYFSFLENIKNIKPLTKEQIDLGRKYAFSYFIERQIPLNVINKSQGHWGDIDMKRLNEMLPGQDRYLDLICDGIINNKTVVAKSLEK